MSDDACTESGRGGGGETHQVWRLLSRGDRRWDRDGGSGKGPDCTRNPKNSGNPLNDQTPPRLPLWGSLGLFLERAASLESGQGSLDVHADENSAHGTSVAHGSSFGH